MSESSEPKLVNPDDPVFPKEVHNLLVAANATNITLSGMADTKASILMGASFVVFSMSISDISEGKASLPLLVLTLFSFVATVFGVLTVRPNKMVVTKTPIPAEKINILFFGSYTNAKREDYIEEMMKVLSSEEETYRRLTADLYDHGKVLRDDKFSWLYWSFTLFLVGMVLTAGAVIYQLTMH
jgi:hypothetical protein